MFKLRYRFTVSRIPTPFEALLLFSRHRKKEEIKLQHFKNNSLSFLSLATFLQDIIVLKQPNLDNLILNVPCWILTDSREKTIILSRLKLLKFKL